MIRIFVRNVKNFQNVIQQQTVKICTIGLSAKNNEFSKNITRKFSSDPATEGKVPIVAYEEIKDLPNHPEKLLIDVREPDELKHTGVIPTSINIPCMYYFRLILDENVSKSNRP